MLPKFLVTDQVPVGFLDALAGCGFEVVHIPVVSNAELMRSAALYSGIVVNTAIIMDAAMLEAATNLKYVLRPGSGLDNIDLEECRRRGIMVFSSPEANGNAVGEHAAGLLLSLLNHIPRAVNEVRHGQWIRKPNTGDEIAGKTVGIIGYGNTGKAFARILTGFNVRLLVYDKYLSGFGNTTVIESTMDDIFREAQIISLHIPLTPETHHLISDDFIHRCSRPFYLINTSRGPITDTSALLRGLGSGKIRGAALDVLENEKPATFTAEESQEFAELTARDNVIITPHIAGWTVQARERIFFVVLEKFRQFMQEKNSDR
jgi:D-3-phosphoglycerate dehydrogenase